MSAPEDTEVDRLLAEIKQNERIAGLVLLAVALLASLFFLATFIGCAHQRKPDFRPAPPPRIEAHLTATPPITIAGHVVTLVAWLDDPEAQVKCPTVTWTWPNGTRSSHTSDCDPDEAVTRHQEIKRGALGGGDHLFQVLFASAGREWRASVEVPVQ